MLAPDEPFALSILVAVAFVRIVTHPGFSTLPTPLPQALAVIHELHRQPSCRLLHPSDQHWPLVCKQAETSRAQGPEIGDVQHAALAMEHGCTWMTRDRDFEKLSTAGREADGPVHPSSKEQRWSSAASLGKSFTASQPHFAILHFDA